MSEKKPLRSKSLNSKYSDHEDTYSPRVIYDSNADEHTTVEETQDITLCQLLKEEIVMLKWRILILSCFLTLGSYYIYDFPGSIGTGDANSNTIQTRFHERGKEYNQEMNLALYSVYNYPNTVLAIFGGLLIDKFLGLRKAMFLFCSLVLLGSILFWVGVQYVNYPIMVFARVIFGLGGESLSVAQSTLVSRWFTNTRGMALAFGITISFCRVGSSFTFLFSSQIAKSWGVEYAVLVGVGVCVISFISCISLIAIEVYTDKKKIQKEESIAEAEGKVMKLKDVLSLPVELWLLTAVCILCYCVIFPFVTIGKNFFEVKFNMSGIDANRWLSLYQFCSAGASPFVGLLVDRSGHFTYWLILACSSFLGIHILFVATNTPPPATMTMMGVFYSFLVSGLWPAVPFSVNERVVGFSYGLMTAGQNAGLATFPLIIGAILDQKSKSGAHTTNSSSTDNTTMLFSNATDDINTLPSLQKYNLAELIFIGTATAAVISAILLTVVDKRHGGILSSFPSRRAVLIKARDADRNAANEAESRLINENGEAARYDLNDDRYI
eukprot:Tbor_TRINITY_DN4875_c0_g1::TRINITY_DN4875_c0_g1_i1::g.1279::m.1279